MFGSNEFTGIVLEGDALKVARVSTSGKKLRLIKLDHFSLVEEMNVPSGESEAFDQLSMEADEDDSIFGLEEEEGTGEEEDEDISIDDLEMESESEEDLLSLDMVEESEGAQSNEILLYNILTDIDTNRVRLGLNITAGASIFQIIRDTNFNEVKKKDLISDLEDKLESIYGTPKSDDYYSYEIRENGSLVLASIEEEPALLELANQTREFYSGKMNIEEIMPDEVILVGLVRANYELLDEQITGIIQFGPRQCRIVFMNGDEIWLVSPIINEGTRNKNFLNTVFSKILFQLDTGEVPNLDRLILANNSLGDEAVEFFQKNFPDISVEDFTFDEELIDTEGHDPATVRLFTNAIGTAWAASGVNKEPFPELSMVPDYVIERQKIFKLQWHGIILLFLIFLFPITFNYFYQQNVEQIGNLEAELERTTAQITEINETVNSANEISNDLGLLREKLVLLDTLSRGSREWSAKIDILNNGVEEIRSSWLTSLQVANEGIFIDGFTLYRSRVPEIVDIFSEATLLNVNIENERDREIYRFSILVKDFTSDKSLYSPPRPEDLQNILSN